MTELNNTKEKIQTNEEILTKKLKEALKPHQQALKTRRLSQALKLRVAHLCAKKTDIDVSDLGEKISEILRYVENLELEIESTVDFTSNEVDTILESMSSNYKNGEKS